MTGTARTELYLYESLLPEPDGQSNSTGDSHEKQDCRQQNSGRQKEDSADQTALFVGERKDFFIGEVELFQQTLHTVDQSAYQLRTDHDKKPDDHTAHADCEQNHADCDIFHDKACRRGERQPEKHHNIDHDALDFAEGILLRIFVFDQFLGSVSFAVGDRRGAVHAMPILVTVDTTAFFTELHADLTAGSKPALKQNLNIALFFPLSCSLNFESTLTEYINGLAAVKHVT